MKTIEEKAEEYCLEVKGQIHQEFIDDFIAGYKAALEWISVDDELPEKNTQIVARNGNQYATFKPVYEIHFVFLKRNFTHWRPIN